MRRPTPGHQAPGYRPGTAPAAPVVCLWVALAAVAAIVASCSGTGRRADPDATDPDTTAGNSSVAPDLEPVDRTVAVVTTGCGAASATIGSAVRLDDTTVLTAAHVVAGAGGVGVVESDRLPLDRHWPGFSPVTLFDGAVGAAVIAFDPARDLALVATDRERAGGPDRLRPEFGVAAVGDVVEIHGAAAAPIEGLVAQRTTIEADEVRGRSRVERDGYRLDAPTTRGDSGAGVWSTDGRLVGLVFAVSSGDGTRSWAVSGREIVGFLDEAQEGPVPSYRCNEATSRLVADP